MGIDKWESQLKKGMAEYVILLILKKGEAYGYEILQALSKFAPLTLGESTVYPILSRLTKEKYLAVRSAKSESGPPRRYYNLTPLGKERLKTMGQYWSKFIDAVEVVRKGKA